MPSGSSGRMKLIGDLYYRIVVNITQLPETAGKTFEDTCLCLGSAAKS